MAEGGRPRGVGGCETGENKDSYTVQVRLCPGAKIPNLKALPIKETVRAWKSTPANGPP